MKPSSLNLTLVYVWLALRVEWDVLFFRVLVFVFFIRSYFCWVDLFKISLDIRVVHLNP